ncbi:hypothetical protein evm_014212 [Chilo suppressalis]|nr:hypothetical protein evm_014212 [Chilo suppressalis]
MDENNSAVRSPVKKNCFVCLKSTAPIINFKEETLEKCSNDCGWKLVDPDHFDFHWFDDDAMPGTISEIVMNTTNDEEEEDEEEKDEDEDTDAVSSDEDEENEFEDAEDSGSDCI